MPCTFVCVVLCVFLVVCVLCVCLCCVTDIECDMYGSHCSCDDMIDCACHHFTDTVAIHLVHSERFDAELQDTGTTHTKHKQHDTHTHTHTHTHTDKDKDTDRIATSTGERAQRQG